MSEEGSLPTVEAEYSPKERELGVGVNQETQSLLDSGLSTMVYYNDSGGTVTIDIENDPLLFSFIRQINDEVEIHTETDNGNYKLMAAKVIALSIVKHTPQVDNTGQYRKNEQQPWARH